MTAAEAEIARLRRELEYAIEAARENGKERDELAMKLGAEVATTQRMKAMLVECANHFRAVGMSAFAFRCIDAIERSGNDNGK